MTLDSNTQKVVDFYKTGMDSVAIEKAGLDPLRAELNLIDTIENIKGILAEIASEHAEGFEPVFSFSVGPDQKNPNKEICHFRQGGLGMPSKEYYVLDDSRTAAIRDAYKTYIQQILTLMGDSTDAAKDARRIYRLEAALADGSLNKSEDAEQGEYKFEVATNKSADSKLDWQALLANMKITGQDSARAEVRFFMGFSNQLNVTPLSTWKKYLQFNLVNRMARNLSRAFDTTHFNFYGRALQGQQQERPRWQNVLTLIDYYEGYLLGQMYATRNFKPETRIRVEQLVANLRQAYADRIKTIDWMGDSTKQYALEKLSEMKVFIGYPEKLPDYSKLNVSSKGYMQNIEAAHHWTYNRSLNRLDKSGRNERDKWHTTPQTVNAFYYAMYNEFVLPAGILQSPLFDADADDAVIYGGLGTIIGHEMTHGFDNHGRTRDAHGKLKNWWAPKDATHFTERAGQVVDEYNKVVPVDEQHVNGNFGEGENLADFGGINIAYEAFKKTTQGQSNEKTDGFTPDQRFFLSWAQAHRGSVLPDEILLRLRTDAHTPDEARCNIPPSNMDAWYKAFDVQRGDKMYRPTDQRVRVW